MNDINRNLPPADWGDKAARNEMAARNEPLDPALVEHALACSRKTTQVTIDSTHLAQLCNEVWRRRREEREARAAGVSAEAERNNRLALMATKAIADVGHANDFPGRPIEATAIVQVANLLAEGIKARQAAADKGYAIGNGLVVYGKPAALEELEKQRVELASARRIIEELERMGWLMKAKP